MKCIFCRDEVESGTMHHMVPSFMTKMDKFSGWKGTGGQITVCRRCHTILHFVLEPIEIALKEELEGEEVK